MDDGESCANVNALLCATEMDSYKWIKQYVLYDVTFTTIKTF